MGTRVRAPCFDLGRCGKEPGHKGCDLRSISICVPLRDEASHLPGLFAAFDALDRDPNDLVRFCLVLDGCTDDSLRLARDYAAHAPREVLIDRAPPSPANAGRARHRAMMLGVRALAGGDGLLLTTDADSRPTPRWLATMAHALDRVDVVAGRIVRNVTRPNPVQDRVEAYSDALFALRRRLDPVPWEAATTHHFAGGANIGIRADAYHAVGGFPSIASGEDARLIDDAGRLGLRVSRDASCIVHTSDRREGRAPGGLAAALHDTDRGDAASVRVAHPQDAAWQYRMHATARAAFADERWDVAADALGLSGDHVRGVARDCPNAEAFAMRIVPTPPGGMREVALPVAESVLADLVDRQLAA